MSSQFRQRRRILPWRRFVRTLMCALVLFAVSTPVTDSAAYTATTVTIDGDPTDWTSVLADPDNVVRDTQGKIDDPDHPGQPDRDVYLVASTYDSTYLYFMWRRTASGQKAITLAAYLDYEGDGLLQDGDKVVFYTVSSGQPVANYNTGTARILEYHQARWLDGSFEHPEGDPMRDIHSTGVATGDGETPDGYAEVQGGQVIPAMPLNAHLDADGIITEARVAWSDLGVAAGHPFAVHFATGNGEKFGVTNKPSVSYKFTGQPPLWSEEDRGNVEDNVEPIMYIGSRSVQVTPDNNAGGAPGSTVEYTHTVRNTGNAADIYDLTAISSRGWAYEILDGSGNPLSSVSLAASSEETVRVRIAIPLGAAPGTVDSTKLMATSRTDANVKGFATDSTSAGLVTLLPDQSASVAPGQYVEYSYTLQNNMPSTGTFSLDSTSTLGFPNVITDSSGTTVSSVSLASGESTTVVVRVDVPSDATNGTQDTMHVTAKLLGMPSVHATALGTTTVLDGFSLDPNRSGYGGAGSPVQYVHTLTNNWPVARTFSLSSLSSQGWPVSLYAADGVTPITSVTVGPWGASADIIVRIAIPGSASPDQVDITTVTATSGATSDSVTDTTTVRRLNTYEDPGCVTAQSAFTLGDQVYARASGLAPGDNVYYVWRDTNGVTVRTSQTLSVDTYGMVFDNYQSSTTEPTGGWTVSLYSTRNGLLETSPLTMAYNAEITGLFASDAPSVNTTVTVTSEITNRNAAAITDSDVSYVMWWDSDGDNVFSAGDIYIDAGGVPHTWDGASYVTPTHTANDVAVPAGATLDLPDWSVPNDQFPNQGYYRVTATWTESNGGFIDVKTTEFYSIPTLGWPVFLLAFGGLAALLGRRLLPLRVAGGASA